MQTRESPMQAKCNKKIMNAASMQTRDLERGEGRNRAHSKPLRLLFDMVCYGRLAKKGDEEVVDDVDAKCTPFNQ